MRRGVKRERLGASSWSWLKDGELLFGAVVRRRARVGSLARNTLPALIAKAHQLTRPWSGENSIKATSTEHQLRLDAADATD